MTSLYEKHIETLINHGAELVNEVERTLLTVDFYRNAVKTCKRLRINAAVFEIELPEMHNRMSLCIWASGRVDSGSMKNVCDCLAQA